MVLRASAGTHWMTDCAPRQWTLDDWVHFDSRDPATGLWGGYKARPDGTERTAWSTGNTHHGIGDVSPDGRYALLTVERDRHPVETQAYAAFSRAARLLRRPRA